MSRSEHVTGWTRSLNGEACQLCTWWWRAGRVWTADHPMPAHKGCICTPQPVTRQETPKTEQTTQETVVTVDPGHETEPETFETDPANEEELETFA